MNFSIRKALKTDLSAIIGLYREVAEEEGGLARNSEEITTEYIQYTFDKARHAGEMYVIEERGSQQVVAEIHAYKLVPRVFRHVLSELTIVVHPEYRTYGLGSMLFQHFLDEISTHRSDIYRVELIARESNKKAISLYERLGFKKEGRLEGRIWNEQGELEADIPMFWVNKNFDNTRPRL